MIETQKFKNRFTYEIILAVRFTGKQEQLIDILDWVIDNGGRAQGNIRADDGLDLMVHEKGVGLVKVKPGEFVVQSESGFEVYPVLSFTQMHEKVASIVQVIKQPVVLEAMQFDGGAENENEIEKWLAESKHKGSYRHTIPGTTITYYRIEMSGDSGSIDIKLNNWIVKSEDELLSMTNDEFVAEYQRVN